MRILNSEYFQNTSWLLIEKVIRLGLTFLIAIAIANYLGPERYGMYGYVISFATFFSAINTLGLKGIMIRDLTDSSEKSILLGSGFILHLIGALATSIIMSLIMIMFMFDSNIIQYMTIVLVSFFFIPFHVLDYFFQSQVKSKLSAISFLIAFLVSSFLKISFVIFKADLVWFFSTLIIENIAIAVFLILFYSRTNSVLKWSFSKEMAKDLITQSWLLIISGVAVSLYMKIDQIMISNMLSFEENGKYAIAARLSEAIYFLPLVITNSLVPMLSKAKSEGEEKFRKYVQMLLDYLALFAIVFTLIVFLLSDQIFSILFDEKFEESAAILAIYIWSSLFVFIGLVSDKWILFEKSYNHQLYKTVLGLIVNVALNFLLIPKYGAKGAAYATLVSYACSGYLYFLFNKSTKRLFFMQTRAIFFPFFWLFKKGKWFTK